MSYLFQTKTLNSSSPVSFLSLYLNVCRRCIAKFHLFPLHLHVCCSYPPPLAALTEVGGVWECVRRWGKRLTTGCAQLTHTDTWAVPGHASNADMCLLVTKVWKDEKEKEEEDDWQRRRGGASVWVGRGAEKLPVWNRAGDIIACFWLFEAKQTHTQGRPSGLESTATGTCFVFIATRLHLARDKIWKVRPVDDGRLRQLKKLAGERRQPAQYVTMQRAVCLTAGGFDSSLSYSGHGGGFSEWVCVCVCEAVVLLGSTLTRSQ